MKKTYIYNVILVAILLIGIASCKKALDINPVDTIEAGKALNTSKDVEAALVGAYADLGTSNMYGGRPFIIADFLGNRGAIKWRGTFVELTQAFQKSLLKTNGFVENIWRDGYRTINDVNNVLAAIDKVDAGKRNRVEGEALFIRGSIFFDLVRLFGKAYNDGSPATNLGVPIVLTPTTTIVEANFVSRSTVAAVYQQAIADLTAAEAKLPEENSFFATKFAAAGMLAKIYLQMGNYPEAANAANRVIISGNYQIAETYAKAFPPMPEAEKPPLPGANTVEDVFAMQVTSLTGVNGFNEFYGSGTFGGRGEASISPDWIGETYEAGDDRINSYYEDGDLFPSKYGNRLGNVSIIRLAEMYLIRAEANARLGGTIGGKTPLEDLSVIRSRVGLTTVSATVADILKERVRELAFEGIFLHDAKRTQTNMGTIAWNDNSLVLPIPQREMDANKKLVQNPGYTN